MTIVFQSTAFTLPADPFFDIICFTSGNGGTSWLQGPFNTILSILILLGIVIDPTTSEVSESVQALKYETPKDG